MVYAGEPTRIIYQTRYRVRMNNLALERAKNEYKDWYRLMNEKSLDELTSRNLDEYEWMETAYCMQKQYSDKDFGEISKVAVRDALKTDRCQFCRYAAYLDAHTPLGPCVENNHKSSIGGKGRYMTEVGAYLCRGREYWDTEPIGGEYISTIRRVTDETGKTDWQPMCESCVWIR